nr:MAG TPA: hypothetical protein [Caudoviricetes sp.]
MSRLRNDGQSPDGRLTRRHTHGRVISGNPPHHNTERQERQISTGFYTACRFWRSF